MKVRVLQLNLVVDMLGDAVSAGVVFNPGFAAAGCHRCIRKKTDLQTDSEGICTISSLNSCVSKWFFTDFFGTVRVKNNEMQFLLLNLPWDTHRQMRKGQFFVCHYNFHQSRIRHHKTSYPIYAIELQN
jgi:hypothetical protein